MAAPAVCISLSVAARTRPGAPVPRSKCRVSPMLSCMKRTAEGDHPTGCFLWTLRSLHSLCTLHRRLQQRSTLKSSNGQRTTDNGQRTTDNGQRTTDQGPRTNLPPPRPAPQSRFTCHCLQNLPKFALHKRFRKSNLHRAPRTGAAVFVTEEPSTNEKTAASI